MKKAPKEMTDPDKIRDFIKSLEDAADKHKHKQPRTIDPVRFAVTIGDAVLAGYKPDNPADAAPPSKMELDYLLAHGIDTSNVKYSGQAQLLITKMETRDKLSLASPVQMDFLRKLTKNGAEGERVPLFSEDWISRVNARQAGAIIGKQRRQWSRYQYAGDHHCQYQDGHCDFSSERQEFHPPALSSSRLAISLSGSGPWDAVTKSRFRFRPFI
jgi:hypothetical protein